ncbi:NAD-dependent epimerase/dehydratase family protein [Paraburkholderia sp. PREW-6R]|uniref:NAD-dependent epimerase/dehydratase family protein n=1 Tax=Paraburkholderia sp. PREW-6R TaxID=3141544 RepID=UPI0031F51C48
MIEHVVLTGANGFVGQAVRRALLAYGAQVSLVVRRASAAPGSASTLDPAACEVLAGDNFVDIGVAWPPRLKPHCVIHLAARVHMMNDTSSDPLAAFRETNVAGTLRVAAAASRAGVRRFVYVSSVKAVAERDGGQPLSERDPTHPVDPYGISKLEAELALSAYGARHGMEIVLVRPPLVYGPGVRANFLSLMSVLTRGIPLPLGAVQARRSMIFVDNLADALVACATSTHAAGETFHVSDGEATTIADFIRLLARQLQAPSRLLPVPPTLLRVAGKLTGRSAQVDRLIDSLQLDTRHIREAIGWAAPYSMEQGLLETANWYRATH